MKLRLSLCVLLALTAATPSHCRGQEIINGEKAQAFFSQFKNSSPDKISVSLEGIHRGLDASDQEIAVSPPGSSSYGFKGNNLEVLLDNEGRRYVQQKSTGAKGFADLDLWLLGGRDSQFSDSFPEALYANRMSYLVRFSDQITTADGRVLDVRTDRRDYLRAICWHIGDYHQNDGRGWSDTNPESNSWHHYYWPTNYWPYEAIKLEHLGNNFQRVTFNTQHQGTRTDGRYTTGQFGATDQVLRTFEGDRYTRFRSETRHYLRLRSFGDPVVTNQDPTRSTPSLLDDGEPVWQIYGVSFWHEEDEVELVALTKEKPQGTTRVKFFYKDPGKATEPRYVYYPIELRNTGNTTATYRVMTNGFKDNIPSFSGSYGENKTTKEKGEILQLFKDINANGVLDKGEEIGATTEPVAPRSSIRYTARVNTTKIPIFRLPPDKPKDDKPICTVEDRTFPREFHFTVNALDATGQVSLKGASVGFIAYPTEEPEGKTPDNLNLHLCTMKAGDPTVCSCNLLQGSDIVLPSNRAPQAIIRATVDGKAISSGATVVAGKEIVLESIGTDPDSATNSFKDMGHRFFQPDGRSGPGSKLRYKTWREGKNTFLLQVSDSYSRAFEDFHITVLKDPVAQAPKAKIEYPETIKTKRLPDKEPSFPIEEPILFSAPAGIGFNHDPDGGSATSAFGIRRFDWDFGDGSSATNDQFPEHTYTKAGTYVVKLTVTDEEGASSVDTQNITITPGNRAPLAKLEPVDADRFMQFGLVEISSALSSDPDGNEEIAKYAWSFTGPNGYTNRDHKVHLVGPRYLFQAWHPGEYTVSVVVTDKWGAEGTSSLKINVPAWDGTYRVNAIGSRGGAGPSYSNYDIDPEIAKGWTTWHAGVLPRIGATSDGTVVFLGRTGSNSRVSNDLPPGDVPDALKGVFSAAVRPIKGDPKQVESRLTTIENLPKGTYEVTAYLYDSSDIDPKTNKFRPGTKYTVMFGDTRLTLTVPENPTYSDFIAKGTLVHPGLVGKKNSLPITADLDDATPESTPLAGFTLKLLGEAPPSEPPPAAPRNLRIVGRQ